MNTLPKETNVSCSDFYEQEILVLKMLYEKRPVLQVEEFFSSALITSSLNQNYKVTKMEEFNSGKQIYS